MIQVAEPVVRSVLLLHESAESKSLSDGLSLRVFLIEFGKQLLLWHQCITVCWRWSFSFITAETSKAEILGSVPVAGSFISSQIVYYLKTENSSRRAGYRGQHRILGCQITRVKTLFSEEGANRRSSMSRNLVSSRLQISADWWMEIYHWP